MKSFFFIFEILFNSVGGFSHPDVAGTLKYLPAALVVSAQSALVPIDHFIPQLLNFELYTPLSIVGLLQRIMLMILIGKAHIMSIGDLHGYKTLKTKKKNYDKDVTFAECFGLVI